MQLSKQVPTDMFGRIAAGGSENITFEKTTTGWGAITLPAGMEWPMLHTDLRDNALMWYREDGVYFYPHTSKTLYVDLATKLAKPVTMMARP